LTTRHLFLVLQPHVLDRGQAVFTTSH